MPRSKKARAWLSSTSRRFVPCSSPIRCRHCPWATRTQPWEFTLRSNSAARRGLVLAAFGLAWAALASAQRPSDSPSDVNLHVEKGHTRQIRLIQNAFTPDGDAGARPQAVTADGVLYADLDQSDVCAVTRAWVQGETPFDVQA